MVGLLVGWKMKTPCLVIPFARSSSETTQGERCKEKVLDFHKEVPTVIEKISYGIPTFFLQKNLVHFALEKQHISLYPRPSGIAAFEHELASNAYSKEAVKFPLDQPFRRI